MSITKRFVDLARSNLNDLLERAADNIDPRRKLQSLSDDELEAELQRRRATRDADAAVQAARATIDAPSVARAPTPASPATPSAAPPPPAATTTPSDREAREKAAREREARVKAERDKREREAQARAQQQRSQPPPRSSAPPPRRPARSGDPQVAAYYARLELPYGSGWDEVKASYRRLMRKYHPDLHAQSPDKLKAATEVSTALTQAYNELEKVLKR